MRTSVETNPFSVRLSPRIAVDHTTGTLIYIATIVSILAIAAFYTINLFRSRTFSLRIRLSDSIVHQLATPPPPNQTGGDKLKLHLHYRYVACICDGVTLGRPHQLRLAEPIVTRCGK